LKKDSISTQKAIDIATEKYPDINNFENIDWRYSINYYPFINKGYQLLVDCYVHDIYIKDSIDYACVHVVGDRDFYFDLSITKDQEKLLLNESYEFIYVVSIVKLQKAKVSLEVNTPDNTKSESADDDDNDNVSTPMDATAEISNSNIFIGKGKINRFNNQKIKIWFLINLELQLSHYSFLD